MTKHYATRTERWQTEFIRLFTRIGTRAGFKIGTVTSQGRIMLHFDFELPMATKTNLKDVGASPSQTQRRRVTREFASPVCITTQHHRLVNRA